MGDVLENIIRHENKVSVIESACRLKFVAYFLNRFNVSMNCAVNGLIRYAARKLILGNSGSEGFVNEPPSGIPSVVTHCRKR